MVLSLLATGKCFSNFGKAATGKGFSNFGKGVVCNWERFQSFWERKGSFPFPEWSKGKLPKGKGKDSDPPEFFLMNVGNNFGSHKLCFFKNFARPTRDKKS